MEKLSNLKENQQFKLPTSDNACVFIKSELPLNQVKMHYTYQCVNSGNEITTTNNYYVFI